MYFLIGACAGGRVCVGNNYISELVPYKFQNLTCPMVLALDALVLTYQGIFYMMVPDWFYVHGVALVISIILVSLTFYYIPESPKYMYANRRYDETR